MHRWITGRHGKENKLIFALLLLVEARKPYTVRGA
jgi:hypothetical protein